MLLFQLAYVITGWEQKAGKLYDEVTSSLYKHNDTLAVQKTRELGDCIKSPFERAYIMLYVMADSVGGYESKKTLAEAQKIAESAILELGIAANIRNDKTAQSQLLKLYNEFAMISVGVAGKNTNPGFNAMFRANLPHAKQQDTRTDGFVMQDKTAVAQTRPILSISPKISKKTKDEHEEQLTFLAQEHNWQGRDNRQVIKYINGLALTFDEKKERLSDFQDLIDRASSIIEGLSIMNIPYVVSNARAFLKLYDELTVSCAINGYRISNWEIIGPEFFSSTETADKLVRGLLEIGKTRGHLDVLRETLSHQNRGTEENSSAGSALKRMLRLIEDDPAFVSKVLEKYGKNGLEFACTDYLYPILQYGRWGAGQVLKYTDIAAKAGAIDALKEDLWFKEASAERRRDAFFMALDNPKLLAEMCKFSTKAQGWSFKVNWDEKPFVQELQPAAAFWLLERDKSLMPLAEKNPVAFGMLATQLHYLAPEILGGFGDYMFRDMYLSELKDAVFGGINSRPGMKRLFEEKPELLVSMLWQPKKNNCINLARAMRNKSVDRLLLNEPYSMARICTLCDEGAHAAFKALSEKKVRELVGGAAGYADLVAKYGVVDLSVVMDCKGVKDAKTPGRALEELKKRLDVFSRLGLKFSNRYDGEILENVYLTATKGSAGGRKLAYIAMNKWDPPGPLELVGMDGLFSQSAKEFHLLMDHGYDLVITENSKDTEMADRFFKHGYLDGGANEVLKNRKYDLLSIAGHGSPGDISLSDHYFADNSDASIQMDDYAMLSSFGNWNSMLTSRATVVLASCFTGYPLSDENRAAHSPKRLFEKLTKKNVVAPTIPIATAMPIFDKDGYVVDADYIKLSVGGVVFYKFAKLLGLEKYVTLSGNEMKHGKL